MSKYKGEFEIWATDDCANWEKCGGRITLFVSNRKCISCDPESYTKKEDPTIPLRDYPTEIEELKKENDSIRDENDRLGNEAGKWQNEWTAVEQERIKLEEKLKIACEGLEFYSNHMNWIAHDYDHDFYDPYETEYATSNERCIGKRAREALAKINVKEG